MYMKKTPQISVLVFIVSLKSQVSIICILKFQLSGPNACFTSHWCGEAVR